MGTRRPTAKALEKIEMEAKTAAAALVLPADASPVQYQLACENLTRLAGAERRVTAWFADPIQALHTAWKTMTSRRALTLKPIQQAIADQKDEIARYEDRRDAIALAAAAADEARLAVSDSVEEHLETAARAPQTAEPQPGIVTAKVWKWRVTDPGRVPAKYLMIDSDKINRVVRAMGGDAEIPGIEVYQDRQIRVTPR